MKRLALGIVLAILTAPLFAQAPARDPAATPGVDKRQEVQQRRIDKGVSSGQITEREAARLQKGQARVERMEAKAREDGVVTRQERARLQHAENAQSRHIAWEAHDRQRAAKK